MKKKALATILITAVFVSTSMMGVKITLAHASVANPLWQGNYEIGYRHSDSSVTCVAENDFIWNPPLGAPGMYLCNVNLGGQPYASHLVVDARDGTGGGGTFAELGVGWNSGFYVYFTWVEGSNNGGTKVSISSADMPVELELEETQSSPVAWMGFYSLDGGETWNTVGYHQYSDWINSLDFNTVLETSAQPDSGQGEYLIVQNLGLWYSDSFGAPIGYVPTIAETYTVTQSGNPLLVDWYPVPSDYGWIAWIPQTTATDTRYFRSDTTQQPVNGLTAYRFETSSSSSEEDLNFIVGWGTWDVSWGIRVWYRDTYGNELELTDGTPRAVVTAPWVNDRAEYQATYTPQIPNYSYLDVPDSSVVIRVYSQVGGGGWGLRATFTTGRLSVFALEPVQWTVTYALWTEVRDTGNGVQSGGNPLHVTYETVAHFYFGISSDSNITDFEWVST